MPKMIGLHHHMSYSPASADVVGGRLRGGSDNKINKSTKRTSVSAAAGRGNDGRSLDDGEQGYGARQRQQLIMGELAADSDHSIRALRVHKIRDDDGDEQQQQRRPKTRTQTTSRGPFEQQQKQQAELIQVQAHTIMPTIVVDSMDNYNNCRRGQDAGARSRALRNSSAAAHDVGQLNKSERAHRRNEINNNNNSLIASMNVDDDQHSNFLYEQRRDVSGQRPKADKNQVVLIISDTSDGTSGVPIIGRLLPSKSSGQNQLRGGGGGGRRNLSPVFIRHAQPPSQIINQMAPQGAVVGRRSHRLLEQAGGGGGARLHRQLSKGSAADNLTLMSQQQAQAAHQQLAQIDGQTASMGWLEPVSTRRLAPSSKPKKMNASRKSAGSSSCSSLLVQPASSLAPGAQPLGQLCLDVCCRAGRRAGRVSSSLIEQHQQQLAPSELLPPPGVCMMPCCQFVEPPEGRSQGRSFAQQQHHDHSTCQANEQTSDGLPSHLLFSRRSSSLCRGAELFGHNSGPSLMLDTNAPRHQFHRNHPRPSRVQANHMPAQQHQHQGGPPLVPCKPTSYNEQLLHLINGRQRDLLLRYESDSLAVHKQQLERDQDSEAVTQMYESLAAELKAKLGNPNRAPILLPPKDYDTLCRKQGRLSGIELRRSTNPQLVGPNTGASGGGGGGALRPLVSDSDSMAPTTTNSTSTSGNNVCGQQSPSKGSDQTKAIAEEANGNANSAGSSPKISAQDSSSRSSGRSSRELDHSSSSYAEDHSHHLARGGGGSLQMSRSNSSSGLGSISISASSPDQNARSSPSQHSGSGSEPELVCAEPHQTQSGHYDDEDDDDQQANGSMLQAKLVNDEFIVFGSSMINARASAKTSPVVANTSRETRAIGGGGLESTSSNQSAASKSQRNGRVEVPLKVNSHRGDGNTYLATKQIIY